MAASAFCSFYASYLQQKAPNTTDAHMVEQINILGKFKRLGTTVLYPRSFAKSEYEMSILACSDAARPHDYGQIGILIGLLVGPLMKDSIFHLISCMSHKSK